MPVPLPPPETADLRPPTDEESTTTAHGLASAMAPDGASLTDTQRLLLEALFPAMTGTEVDLSTFPRLTARDFAEHLAARDLAFRTRCVQLMVLGALVLDPVPEAVVDRVADFARELSVDDSMLPVAQDLSRGAYDLAARDFDRNGYTADWEKPALALHTAQSLRNPWDTSEDDPALAAQWVELGTLPANTLGRGVHDLYVARGFAFPGSPGSAPPLLAQHDWVHVLADYGTTVESELEVFALIARANNDMRAFSLLAMVVSLFETGLLERGAGLFEASPGHLSGDHRVAHRVADAMRRGARTVNDYQDGDPSVDFMGIDWFAIADQPLDLARRRFGLSDKTPSAVVAGSTSPWEPGGISPFQLATGQALAARQDRPYDAFGAA